MAPDRSWLCCLLVMEPWAIRMVVSHSKGCCVTHHERTCVKSPVQSLVHSKCSINGRNVNDDEEEGFLLTFPNLRVI